MILQLIFGEENIFENVFCYFMNVTSLSWRSAAGSRVQDARHCVFYSSFSFQRRKNDMLNAEKGCCTLIFGDENISENVLC